MTAPAHAPRMPSHQPSCAGRTMPPRASKRAMARQAEAEREKRAKIINTEGEALAASSLATRRTP